MPYVLGGVLLCINIAVSIAILSIGEYGLQSVHLTAWFGHVALALNVIALIVSWILCFKYNRRLYAFTALACIAPIQAVLVFFPIIPALAYYSGPSQIRVTNATEIDFQNVAVGNILFGDLRSGASSEYQTFDIAYRYAPFELQSNGEKIEYVVFDYVGEKPLGRGRFSYVISRKPWQAPVPAGQGTEYWTIAATKG
jgi:hypothetical protein